MMDKLLHEDKPHYSIWLKIILWFTIALVLGSALMTFDSNRNESFGMIGTALFIVLIFWAVMPRKYCIYDNKIVIEMGSPFSVTIRFDTIKYAGAPRGKFTVGVNFVTSFGNIVEIDRKKGMTVNISPRNREFFLDNLKRALDKWRGEHSTT